MHLLRICHVRVVVFLLITLFCSLTSESHRQSRTLMYPKGASYKFNVGMGFPVDQPRKLVSFSMNFQFQYQLPRDITVIKGYPEIRRTLREIVDRPTSFHALQNVMNGYGLEGRSCLLRCICEVAESAIYYNGLIGELLHVILTPGYGANTEENLHSDYHEARNIGENGGNCRLAYPSCPFGQGPLDLISLINY